MGFEEAHGEAVALEVRRAKLKLLAESGVRSVPANIFNCLLLSVIMLGQVHFMAHIIWATVMCGVSMLRLASMWRAHKHGRIPSESEIYVYMILTAIVGASWGVAPFIMLPDASDIVMKAVALTIAGMCAGCAVTSVCDRRVVLAYIVPALSAFGVYVLMQGGWQSYGVAGLVVIFGVMISTLSANGGATLMNAIEANIRLSELRRQSEAQAVAMSRLAEYNDAAAKRAERQVHASAAVLANMGHELRTPLNAVLGMSQLLQETQLDTDQRRMTNRIHASGEHLEGMLSDVVDISRIEAGRMDVNLQDISASMISNKIAQKYASKAEDKQLGFVTTCNGDADLTLRGDHDRIVQLISIFTDNAFQFTKTGSVTVDIATQAKSDGSQASLRVEVRDTGMGVPIDLHDTLFDAFAEERMNPAMREAGTGLGLHLAKRMAEFMNGEVGFKPNGSEGSIFWFEIQVKLSERADRYADGEEMTIDRRKLRVLIGEGNTARKSVLLGNLKSMDCIVTSSESLQEIEQALNTSAFDAVVLGQDLNDCDVEHAAGMIRNLPSTASMTPIVRLSMDLGSEVMVTANETLISTPVTSEALSKGLHAAIGEERFAGSTLKVAS